MEKETDSQFYLPFPPARLVKTKDFIKDIMKPAGGYSSRIKPNRILTKFISELHDFSEDNFGETNIFEQSDFYLPPKWRIMEDYLKRKNLIKGVLFETFSNDEPKYYRLSVVSPFNQALTDGRKIKHDVFGHSDSLDAEDVVARAFGEFLERYPLTIYREKDLIKSSQLALRKKRLAYLDINNLSGFSDWQKEKNPGLNFCDKSQFYWIRGKNLLDNKAIFIPTQLVFWNYDLFHKDWQEPVLRERNTNGAGGHCTLTEAILSGLYELIQRDGFLIYWLNKKAPPLVDPDTLKNPQVRSLIEECRQLGLKPYFLNTTSEIGIPSCACAIINQFDIGPKVSLGGGCGTDWENILSRSLTEALSVYHWLSKKHSVNKKNNHYVINEKNYQPFLDATVGQLERLNFWENKDVFKYFNFFLQGKKQLLSEISQNFPEFSSPEEEMDYLVEKFRKLGQGYEIYYYQAKNKILDDLGYYSVRVIVPQLISLYLYETYAPLGAKRIREVPQKIGFKPAEELNPWPHPFP